MRVRRLTWVRRTIFRTAIRNLPFRGLRRAIQPVLRQRLPTNLVRVLRQRRCGGDGCLAGDFGHCGSDPLSHEYAGRLSGQPGVGATCPNTTLAERTVPKTSSCSAVAAAAKG